MTKQHFYNLYRAYRMLKNRMMPWEAIALIRFHNRNDAKIIEKLMR